MEHLLEADRVHGHQHQQHLDRVFNINARLLEALKAIVEQLCAFLRHLIPHLFQQFKVEVRQPFVRLLLCTLARGKDVLELLQRGNFDLFSNGYRVDAETHMIFLFHQDFKQHFRDGYAVVAVDVMIPLQVGRAVQVAQHRLVLG